MKVTIWSHFDGDIWTGEVNLGPVSTTHEEKLERVFRLFNRVEEEDVETLEALGYDLPSLSVDDRVTLHHWRGDATYRVADVGFKRVDPRPNLLERKA